jgi:DNA-binding HxlR family transcriptional regulator
MSDYGQFCPIARSSELLAERWTPILVRNLLNGCTTYSEIRQGAPGISTALLAQRLDKLERSGIVERTARPSGRSVTYRLTEMGEALRPVLDAMGQWGAAWLEIEPRHLDPAYVLWTTAKLVNTARIAPGTTVLRFSLRDRPGQDYWLLLRAPTPELCTRGSGHIEDVVVHTDTVCLVDLHLRRTSYTSAVREGRLALEGPSVLTRQFRSWFRASPFVPYVAH